MRAPTRAAIFIVVLLSMTASIQAQSSSRETKEMKGPTGFIAGRVTNDGKGVPGVAVALLPAEIYGPEYKPITKAVTDESGHYKMTGVPAGHYNVMPLVPAFIVSGLIGSGPRAGKPVNIQAGEDIEDINFTLTRGGVIAGRITDADGKPVIAQYMRLEAIDERGQRLPLYPSSPYAYETDDRGMYRIYGLPAGRYLVSIGESKDSDQPTMGRGGGYYARTFYPNAPDESQAKPIEVTPGSEATDINITLGRLSKAYKASGRIVDADTGDPVPDIVCAYSSVAPDGDH